MTKPISIVPDAKYPAMFRLQWKDGVLSADFYNRTRANDLLQNYEHYLHAQGTAEKMKGEQGKKIRAAKLQPPEAVDAFNETGPTLTSS